MEATSRPVARRHHTVPRFYLRGFAENDRIATVRLPGDRRFLQSVNDASVSKDFYAVESHEDGEDVIEKALSKVEGITAEVFRSITNGTWPLSYDDRMVLGYFISLQATRVPAQRRTMDHIARQMLRLQVGAGGKAGLRQQLTEQGGEVTDKLVETLWDQAVQPEGPPIQRPKVEHISQMLQLAEAILKYVVGRPWVLVRFNRRSLITSDAPVGLIRDPNDQPWQGAGYATAWGITFPLTRRTGLLMANPGPLMEMQVPVEQAHQGLTDRAESGTTELERFFNQHTVANASVWLFHHPDDERFVPGDLPEPAPVTVAMSGKGHEFDGEPWFGRTDDDE